MKPTILIDQEVFQKVMHWVNKSDLEVSGLGIIRQEAGGTLRVVSTMLLPQKNAATHTDIEAEDVNKALFDLRETEGDLKWWWHSHVNMGVFWSGTDMDTIKKLGLGGWFTATVFNKKREVKSAAWIQQGQVRNLPWETAPTPPEPLFMDDLTTKVTDHVHPLAATWDEEYRVNVTEKRWAPAVYQGNLHSFPDRRFSPSVPGNQAAGQTHDQWMTSRGWTKANGVWISPKVTGTNGMSEPTGQQTTEDWLRSHQPPESRPLNMTKRDFKRWKSLWRDDKQLAILAEKALANLTEKPVSATNKWGFSYVEEIELAQLGWDEKDIEEFTENLTPDEILSLGRTGTEASELRYMLANGFEMNDMISMAEEMMASVGGNK